MFKHSFKLICCGIRSNVIKSRNIGFLSGRQIMVPAKTHTFHQDILLSIKRTNLVFKKPKSEAEIKEIITRVCKEFDKIPTDKFTLDSKFIEDLGLDSLDHVELVMALEDEFEFEIPVQDSENLKTANDIVNYVIKHFRDYKNITI